MEEALSIGSYSSNVRFSSRSFLFVLAPAPVFFCQFRTFRAINYPLKSDFD